MGVEVCLRPRNRWENGRKRQHNTKKHGRVRIDFQVNVQHAVLHGFLRNREVHLPAGKRIRWLSSSLAYHSDRSLERGVTVLIKAPWLVVRKNLFAGWPSC